MFYDDAKRNGTEGIDKAVRQMVRRGEQTRALVEWKVLERQFDTIILLGRGSLALLTAH